MSYLFMPCTMLFFFFLFKRLFFKDGPGFDGTSPTLSFNLNMDHMVPLVEKKTRRSHIKRVLERKRKKKTCATNATQGFD